MTDSSPAGAVELDPATYERASRGVKLAFTFVQNWRHLLAIAGGIAIALLLRAEGASEEIVVFGAGYLILAGVQSVSVADWVHGVDRFVTRGESLPERVNGASDTVGDVLKLLELVVLPAEGGLLAVLFPGSMTYPELHLPALFAAGAMIVTVSAATALYFWRRILRLGIERRNPRSTAIFFTMATPPLLAIVLSARAEAAGIGMIAFTAAAFAPSAIVAFTIMHYLNIHDKLLDIVDLRTRIEGLERKRKVVEERLAWLDGGHERGSVQMDREELSRIDKGIARYEKAISLYNAYVAEIVGILSSYSERRKKRDSAALSSQASKSIDQENDSTILKALGKPPRNRPKSFLKTLLLKLLRYTTIPSNMGLIVNAVAPSPEGFGKPQARKLVKRLDEATFKESFPRLLQRFIYEYEKREVLWAASQRPQTIKASEFASFVLDYRLAMEDDVESLHERIWLFDMIARIDPASQYAKLMKMPLAGRRGLVGALARQSENLRAARSTAKSIGRYLAQPDFAGAWGAMTGT